MENKALVIMGSSMKAKVWDMACSSNLGRMPNDSVKHFLGTGSLGADVGERG